ncbi:MAG: tripartite tricarboxylate transporter substrate-binding protein [Vicinamibacterales bacterium]
MRGPMVVLMAGAGLALLGGAVLPLRAAEPLTIVAPAAPGGGWDQTARVLQQAVAASEPGTIVQVENVPGAAGTIGLARFVSAERGNPSALLVTGLVMVSGTVTNRSPVTLAEATPIARLTGEYEVIVVPAASPYQTFADLLAALREAPGAVSWGGGSAGGTDDLLVRLVAEQAGISPAAVNYIAFAGGGAAVAAVLGGQVTAGVSGWGEFAGQIEAGALRPLAVSAAARLPGIDVPTLREFGLAVDLANWRGVVAPPGLSDAERDALVARVTAVAASPAWQEAVARNGWTDLFLAGAPFGYFLAAEQTRVEAVLRRLDENAVPPPTGASFALTPMTAPIAVLFVLAALVLAVSATSLRQWGQATRAEAGPEPPVSQAGLANAGMLLGALVAQAFVFEAAGFVAASAIVFVAGARALGSRAPLRDLVIGLAVAAVLFLAFTRGLSVSLPPTPGLGGWL